MPIPGRATTRPRCLQFLVRLEHRVRVDCQRGNRLLHRRELVADVEEPEAKGVADLLDDLLVWRNARSSVEMEFDHVMSRSLGYLVS